MMISEKGKKWLKFLIGFLGWFTASTLAFGLMRLTGPGPMRDETSTYLWCSLLAFNLILLVVLAVRKNTQWIALGILSAMAANFLITLLFLPSYQALCFLFPVTYPNSRQPTSPSRTTPVVRAPPIGFYDGNDGLVPLGNCVAFGWTTDPNDRNIDLTVRVLSDGDQVAQVIANLFRPDLQVAEGCPGGTCAYNVDLRNLISQNIEHSIQVQAQDAQTGEWKNLSGSPKKLTCSSPESAEKPEEPTSEILTAVPGKNLAYQKPVRVSRALNANPPEMAVDGKSSTWWGAGAHSPQWIEVDLEGNFVIAEIRLLTSQSPAGKTIHRLFARGSGTDDKFLLLHTFEGVTTDSQTLSYKPPEPLKGIRYIRVETTSSPSWVSWREIEVIAGGLVTQPTSEPVERIKFAHGNDYLIVEFLDDDLVHFEMSAFSPGPEVNKPIYATPMVYRTSYPGPSTLTNDGKGILETPDVRVQVDTSSLCVTATDKTKDPDLVLTSLCPYNLNQALKGFTLTPESFTHAYGLGQEFITPGSPDGDWVDRVRSPGGAMGNAMVAWDGGWVGNTQFPIVYFAGNDLDSYALFLDNQYKQTWDFSGDPWKVEMGGDWLRFYLMTGPDLQDLRQDYLELVGHPPVPPKKMFGLWVSEFGFENWAEVEGKLNTLRANHFPVDGFVLDLQWFGGIKSDSDDSPMGLLTWDLANFPDPKVKIADWRDNEGLGVLLIEESYVSQNLPEHMILESLGYLVRDCETCRATYLDSNPWWGKGGMLDWTNDSAGNYWHDWKREPLIDLGITGHWTDLGEPEMYNDWAWYFGIPGDHKPLHQQEDVHNLYNLKWSQSIFEGYLRNLDTQRPFILSRSGAPGSQRYGVSLWSGDIGSNLSSLATFLNAQMHMSMSGMDYYGADIGGFYRDALDGNLDEMYTRWFANGMAFDIPGRPHTFNLCNCNETAPDRLGDLKSNLENVRQRYEISPYVYSLSHRAYLYGEPVFPPLVYYYQEDLMVREMGNEKLIGRDLLVATVTTYGEVDRKVYLPAGDWVNYHTNEWIHSSGEWFGPFPVYQDGKFKLPMFARAGAIIPQMYVDDETMNILGKRTDGSTRNELVVRVYADATASSFTLFEDDGETIAYQKGEVRNTVISQQQTKDSVTVTIGVASGTYTGAPDNRDNVVKLVVKDSQVITSVLLNGASLTRYKNQADFDSATSGWFSAGNNLIVAKSGNASVLSTKTFEFQE